MELMALVSILAILQNFVLMGVSGSPQIVCDVPSAMYATIQSALDETGCETINLAGLSFQENLIVARSVLIQGQGNTTTVVDGGGNGTVFTIAGAVDVTLAGITIINGQNEAGAGINNLGGNVTIRDSSIVSNTVPFVSGGDLVGGGIQNTANSTLNIINTFLGFNNGFSGGGGLNNLGFATISESTFLDNSAMLGGGLRNDGTMIITHSLFTQNGATDGGGISNSGTLTVTESIIESNQGGRDAGGVLNFGQLAVVNSTIRENSANVELGGGMKNWGGFITILGSTFSGNSANVDGGGIYNGGAGIVTITNSTMSGNLGGGNGGGLFNGVSSIFDLKSVTIANNEAVDGDSIFNSNIVNITNSIITSSSGGVNCMGTDLVSAGYNLASDASCNLNSTGDLSNTAPLINELGRYGGQTETHALLPGSPAIDAANDAGCLSVDQRGFVRPVDGNEDNVPHCDIGSFEYYSQQIFLPSLFTAD